jgi:hypothetical protein
MNISTEQYERIIRFLDAGMTLEEMNAFEKELEANPAMRQQLDFEQSVRDSYALNKDEEAGDYENTIPIVRSFNKKKWVAIAIAASVVAALITIFFLQPENKPTPVIVQDKDTTGTKKKDTVQLVIKKTDDSSKTRSTASIYKQYFALDAIPETYPMYLAEALTNYENGNYNSIQKLDLSDIPDLRSNADKQVVLETGHYYKGIAFLKTGNTTQGIINLQWVEKKGENTELKSKAAWYLSLGYLKNNQVTEAVGQLKKVVASTYDRYKKEAENLLIALK